MKTMQGWLLALTLTAFLPGPPAMAAGTEPTGTGAPLIIASDAGPKIQFQIGADLMGGGLDGVKFIGGVNATFVYPIIDLLWVGIRPSLHYLMVDDSPYDVTWMHGDVIVEVNLLSDPVRLYILAAGGYAFALDSDIPYLSHGWSALGGLGVAWRPEEEQLGLFAEAGFRYGSASHKNRQLLVDDNGDYIYNEDEMRWETERVTRQFDLMALTINIGLTFSP